MTSWQLADLTIASGGGPAVSAGTYLAVVIGVGVLCQWLAWMLKVPSLLVLLVTGFALGQWQRADEVLGREVLFAGVTIAVGVILFEGSLNLRFRDLTGISGPVIRLCTAVAAAAWVLISGAAMLVGLDPELAVLVGAILIVTGPTVINPILRQLRPTRRVSSLLRWEGIVVDPMGAILAVLVYQVIVATGSDGPVGVVLTSLLSTLVISFGIAVGVGLLLGQVVRRHLVPDYLQAVLFLGVAIAALITSNVLAKESGLLTVTVLGVVLANQPGLQIHHIREFKEHLQVLLVGVLFIILAGRVTPDAIMAVLPQAGIFLLLLILVVRPLSIALGLAGTTATRRERLLLAFMAPRGIVAAAVTSIFALEFTHTSERIRESAAEEEVGQTQDRMLAHADELARLGEAAESLVPIVFLVIVGTVAVYGLGVGRLAERLGLATTTPQGILFAGATPWTIGAARVLHDLSIPTLIVDRGYRRLQPARMAGLPTVQTNIVSEFAVEELELGGLGSFIGATEDDNANATAAREFAHIFGKHNSYQVTHSDSSGAPKPKQAPSERLLGRPVFDPALTVSELEERSAAGHVVKRTKLTEDFPLAAFRAKHPDAVIMFTVRQGRLSVVTEKSTLPDTDASVIALVREKQPAQRASERSERRSRKNGTDSRDGGSP